VSTDSLGTGRGSLGVCRENSGNRCLTELDRNISNTSLQPKEFL